MATRRRAKATSVLDAPTAAERADVLTQLVANHPDLANEAEQLALELLATATIDGIADEVASALQSIPLEDLASRCGRVRGRGYVHESEAAWELLGEAAEPFLDDIRRRAKLGLVDAAAFVTTGIVAGLYRCRAPEDGTVVAYAGPDALSELADDALRAAAQRGIRLDANAAESYWQEWAALG